MVIISINSESVLYRAILLLPAGARVGPCGLFGIRRGFTHVLAASDVLDYPSAACLGIVSAGKITFGRLMFSEVSSQPWQSSLLLIY